MRDGYCAELTSLSDHSSRDSPQNTFVLGTDNDSAPVIEENFSSIADTRQLHISQHPIEAGNGPLDIPCEVPDDVANQQTEIQGRQLEDGTTHNVDNIPAEPGAELSAGSGGLVGPPQGHDDPFSSGEEETDDAMQGRHVSGKLCGTAFGF